MPLICGLVIAGASPAYTAVRLRKLHMAYANGPFTSDPYENVYCVIRGKKIFTLFPPSEGWLLEGA